MEQKDTDCYTYESRQEIYNKARGSFLQGKAFEINGKTCKSLIEVMYQDVAYLHSHLEDVKEVIIDNESRKKKDVKVGNTPLNKQLANTINTINKRILEAENLKRELGKKMNELLNKNKESQAKLDEQIKIYGCGSEEVLNESEKLFEEMSKLLDEFINSDVISIPFVEYRNQWLNRWESYLKKYLKNN